MSSLTQRDSSQIERYEHDELSAAKRVYIVGGADIKADFDTSQIASSIASAVKDSLSVSSVAQAEAKEIVRPEIIEVEKLVVIKEPQVVEVEKQVVVTQKEFVYVDKPIVVEKIVYKEIEKPVIVKESVEIAKQTVDSKLIAACLIMQTLVVLGLVILKFKG